MEGTSSQPTRDGRLLESTHRYTKGCSQGKAAGEVTRTKTHARRTGTSEGKTTYSTPDKKTKNTHTDTHAELPSSLCGGVAGARRRKKHVQQKGHHGGARRPCPRHRVALCLQHPHGPADGGRRAWPRGNGVARGRGQQPRRVGGRSLPLAEPIRDKGAGSDGGGGGEGSPEVFSGCCFLKT